MGGIKLKKVLGILFALIVLISQPSFTSDFDEGLSDEERRWLLEHQGETFNLGLDPYSGMDYFTIFDQEKGYIIEFAKLIERELNINIHIIDNKSWGEVYSGLFSGEVDILFGANATEERLEHMVFTEAIARNPYVVFAKKNVSIQTIGDLDQKKIGFIEDDIVIDAFPKKYFNINYETIIFEDQEEGLKALNEGKIQGFITSGGGVENEFLYQNPQTRLIAEINSVTSDMTISALKENQVLIGIINKVILNYKDGELKRFIDQAYVAYNQKVLKFSRDEIEFINSGQEIWIGVPNDYLPFEYSKDGQYLGISGALMAKVSKITGLKYKIVAGQFSDLYELALAGKIQMLSMAKTEDRLELFDFTAPYCEDRDIIIGKKSSERIQDVYDLEGKTVAVIDGFWHEEYLRKNLYHIDIVKTFSLEDSLEAIESGRADYLIENPTVVQYYIEGLGYKNLVKKGTTSKDSFFYFGVSKEMPLIVSIFDKALLFIEIDEVKEIGLQNVPTLTSKRVKNLFFMIGILSVIILLGILGIAKLVNVISYQKTQTELLKEREKLLYFDALSGTYNRQYFVHKEDKIESGQLPQAIIIADLNNLKHTNDRYGHHIGDLLIKEFGRILREKATHGIVIRMGGDEFLVIINGMEDSKVATLIQEIKLAMKNTTLPEAYTALLEASFGYVMRTTRRERINEAIKKADVLMYQEKNSQKK